MKIITKILVMGVVLIMCVGIFTACDNTYKDRVDVVIKEEFYDKFVNKNFNLDDFNFDNIKNYNYYFLGPFGYKEGDSIEGPDYVKYIRITIKKSGKRQIKKAIDHFNKLEFVQEAKQARHDDPGYSL